MYRVYYKEERIDLDKHFIILGEFNCGTYEPLNEFVGNEAFSYDRDGLGNTYIVYDDKDNILLYYTLRANSILWQGEYIPLVELSRLAVQYEYQRRGHGNRCFFTNILKKVLDVRECIGVAGILVFAETPEALNFYDSIGFKDFGIYDKDGKNEMLITDDGFNDKCHVLVLGVQDENIEELTVLIDK